MEGLEGLRAICSAPGKVILFGEHAVVYGHPAIAAATDQRTVVEVDVCGDRFTVNGFRLHERHHSYLKKAVDTLWEGDPIRIQTEGGVPSASGTGSSAALTVAMVGALRRLRGLDGDADLAQAAYEVERATQGGGSPVDTSTSTAGGAVAVAGKTPGLGDPLWDVTWEDRTWHVERIDLPEMTVVVGNSGVKGRTDAQVAKVAHAIKRNALVRDALQDLGDLGREAVPALRAKDWTHVGDLMRQAQAALHTVGVNHPAVQHLVDAALACPGTYGAKLTGAGGGGSMVAIGDHPERIAHAVREAGGTAYVVRLGGDGVTWPTSMATHA